MAASPTHAVTGAFGYSGKYITRRLLDADIRVKTLTNSPNRENPFGDRIAAHRFNFDDPKRLVDQLSGVTVLYNTYWVRFDHRLFTFEQAAENSKILFEAAATAGVERIVHVSILNPSADSRYGYYRGKAAVEQALVRSGVSHAILRPGVLFGKEDILINNIAWMLRRLPVFGVFGRGDYRLQPIYVDDLAAIAVREGRSRENVVINCIGPETFTYRDLIVELSRIIGVRRRIVSVPVWFGHAVARLMGDFLGDVVLTREEIGALTDGLLAVDGPPTGSTKLTEWARQHADALGKCYSGELRRRTDRKSAY